MSEKEGTLLVSFKDDEYTKGFKAGVQAISTIIVDAVFRSCPQEAQILLLQILKDKYEDLYMKVAKIDL